MFHYNVVRYFRLRALNLCFNTVHSKENLVINIMVYCTIINLENLSLFVFIIAINVYSNSSCEFRYLFNCFITNSSIIITSQYPFCVLNIAQINKFLIPEIT